MNSCRKFTRGAIAALLIALAGCAGTGTNVADGNAVVRNSGFLSDYSKLQPVNGRAGTYRYIDGQANLRPYSKLLIEPVRVIFTPGPEYGELPPEVVKQLADAFRMEFVGATLSGYHVVDKSGPDVLRIRLAITGIEAAKPDLKATDFIPIKAVINVARSASGNAPQVAEMSGEAEIIDPAGRVVGAAVSTRKANSSLAQGERVTWKDMQLIAAEWAKGIRQHLDYSRGYAAK